MKPQLVLEYTLDHDLRLIAYHGNGDSTLLQKLLGKPLLSVVQNSTLNTLLATLFRKVLTTKKKVSAEYRCDTAQLKRFCTMVVKPLPAEHGEGIVVSNFFDRIEECSQPILEYVRLSSDQFVCICSWCKRLRNPRNEWVEIEVASRDMRLMQETPLPSITHGMCDRCYAYLVSKVNGLGS